MKTIQMIIALCLFNFSIAFANTSTDFDWEETLRVQLNQLIGSKSFSFETLEVGVSDKAVSGTGTFFKKKNIAFTVMYKSENQLAFFEAVMPSNSKVSVTNKQLTSLAGQKLNKLIPDALNKGVYLEKFSFQFSKENKKVEQVQLWFNCLRNWELLQTKSFALEQIKIGFQIDQPTEKNKRKTSGTLTGITMLGKMPLEMTAALSSKKEDLQLSAKTNNLRMRETLQTLCGKSSIRGIPVPKSVIDLQLNEGTMTVAPYQKWVNLSTVSTLGEVDIFVKKNEKKRKKKNLSYLVTISPPDDFKLSKINNNLRALDGLNLGKQKIVISSEEKSKSETSKIPSLSQLPTAIKKGCNLVANLDLTKLKIDHLIGVKNLIVNSSLSDKLRDVALEAALDMDLQLGKTIKLREVIFRLQPAPNDFAIALLGVMDVKIDTDLLQFKGGVELVLTDQSLNFLSLLKGDWHNPLGAKGLTMSNVGIQMGASFTTAPVLLPNLAFTGELKVGRFKGGATLAFDTRNPSKSMMAANFNKLVLIDLVDLVVDQKIKKKMTKEMRQALQSIYLKDISMEVVPQDILVLDKAYDAGFRAAGAMNILGVNGYAMMDIDYTSGIMTKGEIDPVDLKIFKLKGVGKNKRPGFVLDLRLNKTPKVAVNGMVSLMGLQAKTDIEMVGNGFRFMIGGKIFNVFDGQITASGQDLQKAGSMYLKVQMKQDLLGFVDREATKFIENSTEGAVRKLTDAQKEITKAEKAVAGWERQINAMRKVVKKEQAKKRTKYDAAKKKLDAAQKEVNKLNAEIKRLKALIKKKKAWEMAEKTWLEGRVKAVQIAKGTAWLTLEGCKKVMDGFKGINSSPDIDPRVASLILSKNGALLTLKGAKATLEGLKFTLGLTGDVATFIIKNGSKGIVNIRTMKFEGQLGAVSGGFVQMDADIEWMGKKQKVKFGFDFQSPAKSAEAFGKMLLGK